MKRNLLCASVLTALILVFTACSKPDKETDDDQQEFKKYLPVKIIETEENDVNVSTISYLGNTNLIKAFVEGEDREELFYNDKNQPVRLEESNGNGIYYRIDFTLDTSGNVLRGEEYYKNGNQLVPGGYFTYSYNSNKQVISIKYYEVDNDREEIYEFNSNKNVTKYTKIFYRMAATNDDDETETYNLTYDNMSSPFKDTKNFFLFDGILDIIFVPSANNVTSVTNPNDPDHRENRSYEYNIDNFPVKLTGEEGYGTMKRSWKTTIEYKMQ